MHVSTYCDDTRGRSVFRGTAGRRSDRVKNERIARPCERNGVCSSLLLLQAHVVAEVGKVRARVTSPTAH